MDDEALRFLDFHGSRCAICGSNDSDLVVDHDHWSGLVRGFLCNGCNRIEGSWRADLLPLFTRYRRRHPAAIADYFETYKATSAHQIALSFSRRERQHRLRRVATREALTRTVSKISEHLHTSTLACTPEHRHEWRMAKCMAKILRTCTDNAGADDGVNVTLPEEICSRLYDLMTVLEDAAERALGQHSVNAVEEEVMSLAAEAASWVPPWERPGYVSRHEAVHEVAGDLDDRRVDADSTAGHIDQIRDLRDLAQSGRRLCWRISYVATPQV
jgi:hypothetical protein